MEKLPIFCPSFWILPCASFIHFTFTHYNDLFNIILQCKVPNGLFPSLYPPALYALVTCPIFRPMMTNYEQRFFGLVTKSFRYAIEPLGWGGDRGIVRPTEILVAEGDSNSRSDSSNVRKMVSSALPLESPPGRALVQFFQNSFDLRPP